MIKNKLTLIFLSAALAMAYAACKPEEPNPTNNAGNNNNNNDTNNISICDTVAVTYDATIKGIIANYGCTGCHFSNPKNFNTYNGLKGWLSSGNNASIMIKAINHQPGVEAMPQGGKKMDSCDIKKIEAWIHQGYKQN